MAAVSWMRDFGEWMIRGLDGDADGGGDDDAPELGPGLELVECWIIRATAPGTSSGYLMKNI